MVYDFTCNGCKALFLGQTCQHITARVAEHAKVDPSMGVKAIQMKNFGDTSKDMQKFVFDFLELMEFSNLHFILWLFF